MALITRKILTYFAAMFNVLFSSRFIQLNERGLSCFSYFKNIFLLI